ncbi:MAG: 2-methylisocitrate lyase-like PEP mutase family enzyme [Glaciecola sp.]|jgi:2-methylisocitrate lyase-like PEP mutase family enzyme
MSHARSLRDMLATKSVIKAPGVYDGLSTLLVEKAGFPAAFLSGGSLSFSRFGRPDMGLVTASEVADTVAIIRERTNIPLIVDMDTGFGNALNVRRTVETFERAGASALQMEDQVAPKRCGHMAGKQVISINEMVGKIEAALDARRNEDTIIVARTDALGVNGFDDAIERGHKYVEAGCDVLFIEAPKSVEQMKIIGNTFADKIPLMHNLVEGGGSPIGGAREMADLRYKLALYPVALLHLFVKQAPALLQHILDEGSTTAWQQEMIDLKDMNILLGSGDLLNTDKKYAKN